MNPMSLTVSLVPQARGGPFILWDPLPDACRKAKALGFDAVEIFPPGPELDAALVEKSLKETGLKLAAMGTGAGWVLKKLTLTSADPAIRREARDFTKGIIDLAANFGAPAILGSMQGRWGGEVDRTTAVNHLCAALEEFGDHAGRRGVTFLLEPLNRYEGNVVNTLEDGVTIIQSLSTRNVTLLADLFHMNIEERSITEALRAGSAHITHVQLADSNRRPPGHGHTDFHAVASTLRSINYRGYLSAEALPWPNPDDAARLAMDGFRRFFRC